MISKSFSPRYSTNLHAARNTHWAADATSRWILLKFHPTPKDIKAPRRESERAKEFILPVPWRLVILYSAKFLAFGSREFN
jgi:hypothetical protein